MPDAGPVTLKRSLRYRDLILYGIILIQPTAPMPVFGVIYQESRGHVVLAILLALVAMLGAVNGVLTTPLALLWTVLNNTFGVIGAAVFQPFQIFSLLAAWLMPIRGVFLLTGVVSGFGNFLSGDPSGITTLYWGIAGGVAGEIAMLIVGAKPERRSLLVIVAALLYIPATNVITFFVYGWQIDAVFFVGVVLSLIAIVVESALPAIGLGRWIIGTGLLRTAPVPLTATARRTADVPA